MEGRKKKQDQGTGNVLPSLVAGMKYHFYNVFSWGALSGWKSLFSPCEVRISNREHGRKKERGNNRTIEQENIWTMEGRRKKKGKGIDSILFWKPFPAANYDRFRYWKQNHGGGLAPRGTRNHRHQDVILNSESISFPAFRFSCGRGVNTPPLCPCFS